MNLLEFLPLPSDALIFAMYVALGGLCVSALVLGAAFLVRRRPEPLRYGILLTGVLGLLAVPALVGVGIGCQTLPWFAVTVEDEIVRVPLERLNELLERPAEDVAVNESTAEGVALAGENLGTALLALWVAGIVIGLCRLLRAVWKQSRAMVGAPLEADFWTDEMRERLAQKLGLRRFPAVHASPAAPMPMVVGILRPIIVLPFAAPVNWGQQQWEAVLLHEAAHIARRDHWAALAQRLAVVLFWWCPLVHGLARRLNELREHICDDCALAGACDQIAYAELLVESAEHFLKLKAQVVPLGLVDSARSGLEARVNRLLEKERPTMTRLSLPGKILGALFLLTACLMTTAGTAFSGGQAPPQKKIQIKIIVDGKEIDLGDVKLLEHIEAAQKKAEIVEVRVHAFKALEAAKGAHAEAAKNIAFSPDGKFLATGDGKRIIIVDAQTGKVVVQPDAKPDTKPDTKPDGAKPDPNAFQRVFQYYVVPQQGQPPTKADPRIEELVKQAEAIKPGSGDTIRKALQANPHIELYYKDIRSTKPVPAPAPGVRVIDLGGGKKGIVIEIDNLNVQPGVEWQKFLGDNLRFHFDFDAKKDPQAKPPVIEFKSKVIRDSAVEKKPAGSNTTPLPSTTEKKAAPSAAAPDLEALSRQLERLNAELNELRKRLDTNKK